MPEELGSLTSAAQAARSEFEKGNYTEALKAAQALPAQIQAALAAATVKKDAAGGGLERPVGHACRAWSRRSPEG